MMVLKIARALRNMHRDEKGFTLIELLIVIAILAVLAAIAIPLVVSRVAEARESAHAANISILQRAVHLYNLDCGQYPPQEGFQAYLTGEESDGCDGWRGPYITRQISAPEGSGDYKLVPVGPNDEKYIVIAGEIE